MSIIPHIAKSELPLLAIVRLPLPLCNGFDVDVSSIGGSHCLSLRADGEQSTPSLAVPSTERSGGLFASVAPLSAGKPGPPLSNRGGQSAAKPKTTLEVVQECPQAAGVSVDWSEFTLQCLPSQVDAEVAKYKALLGDDWLDLERGFYGYACGVRCGGVFIFWGGHREDMGVHVQVTGSGCRELEGRGLADWRGWYRDRFNAGVKFTRVDHAFDDREGRLCIDRMEADFKAGRMVSRFNSVKPEQEYDGAGNLVARGLNLGKRENDTSICIYDKALEQRRKLRGTGLVDVAEYERKAKELEGHWVRLEMRSRKERADLLVGSIIQQGFTAVASVLRGYLEFKAENPSNQQKARQVAAPWWLEFIGWAEKTRLSIAPVVKSLQQSLAWLDQQAGAVLGMVVDVVPEPLIWLLEVAARGSKRHGIKHKAMMQVFKSVAAAATPARRPQAEDGRTAACLLLGGAL